MKTVLISTTCLWNCGDDFIREGILELLQLKPNVRVLWWNRGYGIKNAYTNSLDINLPLIDYFIVAGTPEWLYKNEHIYRYCINKRIPISIIGVGTRNVFGRMHRNLLKEIAKSGLCEVAMSRDKDAAHVFKELKFQNTGIILDPAFFMKPLIANKTINILTWRGYFIEDEPFFRFRYPHKWIYRQLNIKIRSRKMGAVLKENYNNLMKKIFRAMPEPKEVLVHDNYEIQKAEELFETKNVFYSTDYREMFKRYSSSRIYVGSRIHGAIPSIIHGAAASLLYTNVKAEVLESSLEILSRYISDFSRVLKVKYLNDKNMQFNFRELVDVNPLGQKIIVDAINKEKQRVREILKSQPILSSIMM